MPTKIKAKLSNVTDESNLEECLIFFVCFLTELVMIFLNKKIVFRKKL